MKDLTGQTINGFLITGFSHKGERNRVYWEVKCPCGRQRTPMRKDNMVKHKGKCTCDKLENGFDDLTGKVFNKLTVLSYEGCEKNHSYWRVKCECGKIYKSRRDAARINRDGCGSHIRPYEVQGEKVKVEVSTPTHPNTFTYVDKVMHQKYMLQGSWWCIQGKANVKYVQGTYEGNKVMLHKIILPSDDGRIVDHIDGDGLNNTASNLRLVSKEGNARNCSKPNTNTSGHIGVSCLPNGKFRAYITIADVQKGLGTYNNIEGAINARKEAQERYNFHPNHGRDAITYN